MNWYKKIESQAITENKRGPFIPDEYIANHFSDDIIFFFNNGSLVVPDMTRPEIKGGKNHIYVPEFNPKSDWRGRYNKRRNTVHLVSPRLMQEDKVPNIFIRQINQKFGPVDIKIWSSADSQIKTASFIHELQISDHGRDWLSIWINGKKYEYKGLNPTKVKEAIHDLKALQHNKTHYRWLGKELAQIVKKLHKYLVK